MKVPMTVAIKRGDNTIDIAIVSIDGDDDVVTDEFSFPCPIAWVLRDRITEAEHG